MYSYFLCSEVAPKWIFNHIIHPCRFLILELRDKMIRLDHWVESFTCLQIRVYTQNDLMRIRCTTIQAEVSTVPLSFPINSPSTHASGWDAVCWLAVLLLACKKKVGQFLCDSQQELCVWWCAFWNLFHLIRLPGTLLNTLQIFLYYLHKRIHS